MYSLSKGPISPKGFPEVNFSFAETSFEKVYERLQKDIKIVESQDENDFIANTSSVDTFYSETNNSKQQFDGSRNQVQLIRESDGTFKTITGEKVVLLDHLGHKVQLIPVSGDSNTSSTFSIKALSDENSTANKFSHTKIDKFKERNRCSDGSVYDFPDEVSLKPEPGSAQAATCSKSSQLGSSILSGLTGSCLTANENESSLDEDSDVQWFSHSNISKRPNILRNSRSAVNRGDLKPFYSFTAEGIISSYEGTDLWEDSLEGISPSHFPKTEDAFHEKNTCALASQEATLTPSPKRKLDEISDENSEKKKSAVSNSAGETCCEQSLRAEENEDDPLTNHVDSTRPKFDIYKHIKFDSDHVVENQSRVYHCGICGNYAALSQETLEKHWKSHYQERPFKCPQCDKAFKLQSMLNNHMNTHKGRKPYECEECSQAFVTKGELTRHQRYRHTSYKPHQCPECDYASVEVSKLKRHMRSHTGDRPFRCHLCSYCCADNFKLKRHLKTHTGEKPYECPVCKARFTQAGSMRQHLLGHTGDKPRYQCEYCDTTCGRRSDLKQHMLKMHTSQRPQKCRYCNVSFPDRHNLKEHLRKHRGEKVWKCDLCDYRCQQQRHLKAHRMTHTGERPYICTQCGQQFRLKQQLKDHVTRTHVESVMSLNDVPGSAADTIADLSANSVLCSLCNRRLASKAALRQHLRATHKLDQVEIENMMEELSSCFNQSLIETSSEETLVSNEPRTLESDPQAVIPAASTIGNGPVPTIVLTCTSDHVCASVVGGDPNALSNYDSAITIPGITDQSSDAVVEAEFILTNGTEKVSILVSPQILVNGFLLQSLQTALEQSSTLRSIGAAAYERRSASALAEQQSAVPTDVIISKDLHSSEKIDGNTGSLNADGSGIDASINNSCSTCIIQVEVDSSNAPSETITTSGATSQFSTIDTTVLEIS